MKTTQNLSKILLFASLLLQTGNLLAQSTGDKIILKGFLSDSTTRDKLAFVTVKLNNDKGETAMVGVTKQDGSFSFSAIKPSTYLIVITTIGYVPKTFSIDLQKDTDLGLIALNRQVNSLKEVSITGNKPIINQKADRIIYDLQADPESKSSSVLEIMHKIPYITLDGQDNIMLKGNSSFKVFINGKPSPSTESNLNAILKSMPASTIEKIEVITIPPSKYDGEGLAGIINIITTKKLNNGFSGSLNANESFPTGGPRLGGSITAKSGKFAFTTFGGASIVLNPKTTFTNSRETFGNFQSSLLQAGDRRSNSRTAYFGTEMSYEIDSLHLFSGAFNLNGNRATDDMKQLSNTNGPGGVLQSYNLLNDNEKTGYGWDASINYQIGFKKVKNRLLTFSYQSSKSQNDRNGNVAILNPVNFNTPDYRQNDEQQFNEQTLQIDFVTPVNNVNIEAGIKGILRSSKSNFAFNSFNSATAQFEANSALSNQYTNNQDVFSAYNSYQINLKSWNIQAGFRVEQTVISADFISSSTVAKQNYLNVLPSIAISKNFSNQSTLNFGFSQRIRRPGINRLNPYVDRSNPNFELTGNPNLRPVLLNDIQVGYSSGKKLSLNIGLDYSFMNNLDLQVADFDPITQITRTSYANTGISSSLGSNLSVSYPISKTYNMSLNGNVMYLWLQGTADGIIVNNDRLMYSFSFSNSFRFNHGWSANANLNLVSSNPTGLQGYSNGFIATVFSVSKELIKNKFGLVVRVNNPFTKYRDNIIRTFGPDFSQFYTSRDYFRSFSISLNYKFGGLKSGVNKSRKSIENNDMAN